MVTEAASGGTADVTDLEGGASGHHGQGLERPRRLPPMRPSRSVPRR